VKLEIRNWKSGGRRGGRMSDSRGPLARKKARRARQLLIGYYPKLSRSQGADPPRPAGADERAERRIRMGEGDS
jgi:hypothetical protein